MRVNQQHSHLLTIPLFSSVSKLLSFASVLPVPTKEKEDKDAGFLPGIEKFLKSV